MMTSRKRRFPTSTTKSITSFFSTNKETVDSEMEEKESKDDDSDEEATDKSQKPNSSRHEKKFNTWWLNDYTELVETHNSGKGMLCELCIRSGKQPPFNTGCTNFRTFSLTRHAESTDILNFSKLQGGHL